MRARYLQCSGVRTIKPQPLTVAVMHYVVNNAHANALQGYSIAKNATLYAVFATLAQANAHVKRNKMQLYATVISA